MRVLRLSGSRRVGDPECRSVGVSESWSVGESESRSVGESESRNVGESECEMQGYPFQNMISANFLPGNVCEMPKFWKLQNLPNPVKCKCTPYNTGFQLIPFLKTFVKY